jgi:hypothetical protein
LAQFAEGLQLFGCEHATNLEFRERAQAHERGLCRGDFGRALLDERLVQGVGVYRLV